MDDRIDETDRTMIGALRHDGRATITELARTTRSRPGHGAKLDWLV